MGSSLDLRKTRCMLAWNSNIGEINLVAHLTYLVLLLDTYGASRVSFLMECGVLLV